MIQICGHINNVWNTILPFHIHKSTVKKTNRKTEAKQYKVQYVEDDGIAVGGITATEKLREIIWRICWETVTLLGK